MLEWRKVDYSLRVLTSRTLAYYRVPVTWIWIVVGVHTTLLIPYCCKNQKMSLETCLRTPRKWNLRFTAIVASLHNPISAVLIFRSASWSGRRTYQKHARPLSTPAGSHMNGRLSEWKKTLNFVNVQTIICLTKLQIETQPVAVKWSRSCYSI